ncbi:Rrf2 family transcriptional regulator [Paenibacillus sp. N1-5-1-14]|uniref:RrF2 family transcriptional regulator n=1 Tax=Paenibacillus radicibacter TaxID=2972488 RepID=UPI0021594C2E|nr:Rrf2 family transcriptional regulator [Paenibacillus radicibacter]MCR8644858.1 Rrf2 family transcriptional regulator [Paenibacillus radicibacter]
MNMNHTMGNNPPKWFGYAVQSLVYLAKLEAKCACPSGNIAENIDSQATLLRRVLAALARANIVHAQEGRVGGYRLAKPMSEILLSDVYLALQIRGPLFTGLADTLSDDKCGQALQEPFAQIVGDADELLLRYLSTITLEDVVNRAIKK